MSAFDIGRGSYVGWPTLLIAGAALVATTRHVHPVLVLAGGAVVGLAVGLVGPLLAP